MPTAQRSLKESWINSSPKGRPRKQEIDECTSLQNEVIDLRVKVDVLQIFFARLEGGERQISCYRAVAQRLSSCRFVRI